MWPCGFGDYQLLSLPTPPHNHLKKTLHTIQTHNKMSARNLCSLILKCICWQLDSSNGTYCFDANNKDKDGLQDAYNEAEDIYQERVNLGASTRLEEVLWSQ
jgi:hypothetical protein